MSESSKERKNLFKNVSWLFGGGTASSVFTALETIILARMLGVENFGLLSLVIAYVRLLNRFFDFRVWETSVKYVGDYWESGEKENARSMIKLSYIVDILSGVLAFAIALLLAKFINSYFIKSDEGFIYIVIYSFSLLISTANSTSEALLRVFDKFKDIAFVNSLQTFIRLLLVLGALYLGFGIKGVLISYVLASFLGFVILQFLVNRILNSHGLSGWIYASLNLINEKFREIAHFLINTNLMGTLKMANESNLAIMVLGYFTGKEAAGLYKVARSVVKVMYKFTGPVYQTIYPSFVRLYNQRLKDEFSDLIRYSLKTLMKFTLPISIFILFFAGLLISTFFGKDYLSAANTMRLIIVAVLVTQFTFWVGPALLAVGKPGMRTILEIINSIFYVIFLLFLVGMGYGIEGAGAALLLSSLIKSAFSYYFYKNSVETSF